MTNPDPTSPLGDTLRRVQELSAKYRGFATDPVPRPKEFEHVQAQMEHWFNGRNAAYKAVADELAALVRAVPLGDWKPIETAPRDGSWFWVKREDAPPKKIRETIFKWDAEYGGWFSGTGWWGKDDLSRMRFTHWRLLHDQPFPDLPPAPVEPAARAGDWEHDYSCHAVELVADMLEKLKPDELEGRAAKLVATLRHAASRLRASPGVEPAAPRDRQTTWCINCYLTFGGLDCRHYYGANEIGPFCEPCDQTIKLHTRFVDNDAGPSTPILKWLDDIEAQCDDSVPYYVPSLIAETRKAVGLWCHLDAVTKAQAETIHSLGVAAACGAASQEPATSNPQSPADRPSEASAAVRPPENGKP